MRPTVDAVAPGAYPLAGSRVGRFRWVICALLFFITTINYMDRQIIGVLKPVLAAGPALERDRLRQHRLLLPARLRRRLCRDGPAHGPGRGPGRPHRRRHHLEPRRGRPRLGALGVRLRARPLPARHRRGRQLPGGDQDGQQLVPGQGTGLRDRHLQRREQRRCAADAAARALDRHHLGLARRLLRHRADRLHLAGLLAALLSQRRRRIRGYRATSWPTSAATRTFRPRRSPGCSSSATAGPGRSSSAPS